MPLSYTTTSLRYHIQRIILLGSSFRFGRETCCWAPPEQLVPLENHGTSRKHTQHSTPKIIARGMFGRALYITPVYTRGIFGGRTQVTELSGTGMEVVPNLPKRRVPVLGPYRSLPKTSVGYFPSKKKKTVYFGTASVAFQSSSDIWSVWSVWYIPTTVHDQVSRTGIVAVPILTEDFGRVLPEQIPPRCTLVRPSSVSQIIGQMICMIYMIYSHLMTWICQAGQIYSRSVRSSSCLNNLRDVHTARVSWVGPALCRSCTTPHSGRWGTRRSTSCPKREKWYLQGRHLHAQTFLTHRAPHLLRSDVFVLRGYSIDAYVCI